MDCGWEGGRDGLLATIKRFEDIAAWKKARLLVRMIYEVSQTGKFKTDYAFRDQIRRSAVSIMANIAEGFGRNSRDAFANHLNIARGSAAETQSLLYVALD